MRNATLTTIAPTGSIAMAAGCSYGIEPHFALVFHKEALGGISLPEVNDDLLENLRNEGIKLSNGLLDEIVAKGSLKGIKQIPGKIKQVFVTAHELGLEDHIKMQAAFQKQTDNAVSKTINLRADAQIADVSKAFMMAWKLGCKGITVYRDQSRSEQVLNLGYSKDIRRREQEKKPVKKKEVKKQTDKCPQCNTKMFMAEGCSTCPSCAFSVCSI